MEKTAPKQFVFVLMPFSSDFDDVYKLGIKVACEQAGAYCERVDEQMYEGTILNRIYNQISTADLIIADMTGRNPNVFYEVGYAHALDKRVILLTKNENDIPFDLKHYPHIVYEGSISGLKEDLTKRVRWALSNAPGQNMFFALPLKCFVNGVLLRDRPAIDIDSHSKGLTSINLEVSFSNSMDQSIQTERFKVGLIAPQIFGYINATERMHVGTYIESKSFPQSDGTWLHLLTQTFTLLPGAWDKFYVDVITGRDQKFEKNAPMAFSIRSFTTAGTVDYPFTVIMK
jgi:hypothetical protein